MVLNRILNFVVFLVLVFAFLVVFEVDFTTFVLPYFTLILSISFIFSGALSKGFDSFVFLFFGTLSCAQPYHPTDL